MSSAVQEAACRTFSPLLHRVQPVRPRRVVITAHSFGIDGFLHRFPALQDQTVLQKGKGEKNQAEALSFTSQEGKGEIQHGSLSHPSDSQCHSDLCYADSKQ